MCVVPLLPVSCALIYCCVSQSNHLSVNQYNWLGTIFSLAYLAFEYPQNLALQRWPVGKWMRLVEGLSYRLKTNPQTSINIFIWSIALLCHAACKDFGGLFAVRFVLGMCEGAITPGFMIVCAIPLYTPVPAAKMACFRLPPCSTHALNRCRGLDTGVRRKFLPAFFDNFL